MKKDTMTTRNTRTIAILAIALILFSACDSNGNITVPNVVTAVSADVIYTAAAQTLAVQLTQNAPTLGSPTDTPATETPVVEVTNTPQISPTFTEAPATATPQFTNTPIFTSTSSNPTITAIMPTNCRTGTSKDYPNVGSLNVGQVADVVGRNSTSTWWYIKNPGNPGGFCWVWSETTTVTGATSALTVMTPPPPPPTSTSESGSSFTTSYVGTHKCSGELYAYFQVKNNGGTGLESASIKIRDDTDNDIISGPTSSNSPILSSASDCSGKDTLEVGDSAYVAGLLGSGNVGHQAKVSITLCTDEDLEGACSTIIVKFAIP